MVMIHGGSCLRQGPDAAGYEEVKRTHCILCATSKIAFSYRIS